MFTGTFFSGGGYLRREETHEQAVYIGCPHRAVTPQKTGAGVFLAFERAGIDQHFARKRQARRGRACRAPGYGTRHGFTSQISVEYSAMVRSLENLPELA